MSKIDNRKRGLSKVTGWEAVIRKLTVDKNMTDVLHSGLEVVELPNAIEIRKHMQEVASNPISMTVALSRGHRGAITGALNKRLGSNEVRHLVLGWLFNGSMIGLSSKTMTDAQWFALSEWVGFWEHEGSWKERPMFYRELGLVLTEVVKAYNALDNAHRAAIGYVFEPLLQQAVQIGGIVTAVGGAKQDKYSETSLINETGAVNRLRRIEGIDI